MSRIGAVVVSFNSAAELAECLGALLAAEGVASVVVVDNASSDDSVAVARRCGDPRLVVLEVGRNTGFAGGCNRGLAALPSELEVVAMLNPDVRVSPDCLARAAAHLSRESEVAAVAPRLMRADGRTVDSVGQVLKGLVLEVRDRGYGGTMGPELAAPRAVLAACGALAVFRRQALAAVAGPEGPWAEHFFCFWEDLELGWRLNNHGFSVVALPEAVATHHRGAGASAGSGPLRWRRPPELEANIITNRWLTLVRHLHLLDLVARLPLLLAWDVLAMAAGVVRRPVLGMLVLKRLPLVAREIGWRRRHRRRRLRDLPC